MGSALLAFTKSQSQEFSIWRALNSLNYIYNTLDLGIVFSISLEVWDSDNTELYIRTRILQINFDL